MDESLATILSYISVSFLCICMFLYIVYGKNLMQNHRVFFFVCLILSTITIVGLFTDQTIAIVSSTFLLSFMITLIIMKIINNKKLKGVGLRSYRSFTVN